MRADRLLRLLALLQRHRRATAAWLATELEVSERTVLRDMEALSAAGVPVYTERGRGGGCVLLDGFTTRASGLTPGEAQALFAWAGRESTSQLGLGGALASALTKIAATAPSSAVEQAEALGEVVHADRRSWYGASDDVPFLPVLREATSSRRRLRLRYTAADAASPSTRTVDPIGVVDSSGRWYLVAEHRRRRRIYRVSRIASAQLLSEPSTPADSRPLPVIWAEARAGLERGHEPLAVVVSVDPDPAGTIRRLLGMQLVAGTTIESEPGPDGREVWRLSVRQPEVLAAVAALHAPALTVLSPGWLIDDIRAAAERTLRHYGDGGPAAR